MCVPTYIYGYVCVFTFETKPLFNICSGKFRLKTPEKNPHSFLYFHSEFSSCPCACLKGRAGEQRSCWSPPLSPAEPAGLSHDSPGSLPVLRMNLPLLGSHKVTCSHLLRDRTRHSCENEGQPPAVLCGKDLCSHGHGHVCHMHV